MNLLRSFYSPPKTLPEKEIILDSSESLHLIKVRRARKDERVSVFDGQGNEWLCAIDRFDPKHARLKIIESKKVSRPSCSVTLFQALPKGKIMESIIQKATELGAAQVVIFQAERGERTLTVAQRIARKEKWNAIAIESCKQCGMSYVPQITFQNNLREVLAETSEQDLKLIASLEDNTSSLRSAVERFTQENKSNPQTACWLIGPEGDFTREEYQLAAEAGFEPISLGGNVLRVETAAIVTLGLLMNELRELNALD